MGIVELDNIKENEMKEKTIKGIQATALIGTKIEIKWEKQKNSNEWMGSGCIQIRSKSTTVEIEWIEK